ncbi:hypothetical protein AB0I39_01620 [Kitasatospora purpeofusca]|uniref:hypothetical protein n=1 Tax=Kitasatospora purpeofusca TaxID=67352 RepID=UPI0033D50E27
MNEQPSGEGLTAGEVAADAAETQRFLLNHKAQRRLHVPVRRDFVQLPPRSESRHSVLAQFVRGRDVRGLRAYLFILAITSSDLDNWSTTLNSSVWARAIGATDTAEPASARAAVTKIFSRLHQRGLITCTRLLRTHDIRVTLLREDGKGGPYTRPGKDNRDPYLRVPRELWDERVIDDLSLPALAMLLVLSCERPGFELPSERAPEWYGWSADTAERGFRELVDKGLAGVRKTFKSAPASPRGYTHCNRYTLVAPYAHRGRVAQEEVKGV